MFCVGAGLLQDTGSGLWCYGWWYSLQLHSSCSGVLCCKRFPFVGFPIGANVGVVVRAEVAPGQAERPGFYYLAIPRHKRSLPGYVYIYVFVFRVRDKDAIVVCSVGDSILTRNSAIL